MSREIQIEIASDVVKANIVWLPFQLNPGIPDEGMARPEYRKAKFGSIERGK